VAETANQAFDAAMRIVDLFKTDRERISTGSERAGAALRIHDVLQTYPYATGGDLVNRTGISAPTVNAALAQLQGPGIVDEITGRRRGACSLTPPT
jgi:Fic family protein